MIDPALAVLAAGLASTAIVALRARGVRLPRLGGVSLEVVDECVRVGDVYIRGVLVEDLQCLVQGGLRALELLSSSRSVAILAVVKRSLDRGRVLRDLENRIVSLRIVLEREPGNKSVERRLRILERVYESILSGEPPLAASLLILTRGVDCRRASEAAEEVAREIRSSTLCRARVVSGTEALAALFTLSVEKSPVPNRVVARVVHEAVSGIPSGGLHGVYIGLRRVDKTPFLLPLWSPAGAIHTLILGPTGRGKTSLASAIAVRASALDSLTLLIDPKGDAARYTSGLLNVREVTASEALSALLWLYREGVASPSLVSEALSELGLEDSLEYVLEAVESDKPLAGVLRGRSYYRAARLGVLDARASRPRLEESTVLDLSSLPETLKTSVMVAYALAMLGLGGRKLLVVDEAWRLGRTGRSQLVKLLKEARSRNLALILATQDPGDMPDEAYNNIGNFVVFGSPDRVYVERVSRVLTLDRHYAGMLRGLGVGEALVKTIETHKPELVEIDASPLRLGTTTAGLKEGVLEASGLGSESG